MENYNLIRSKGIKKKWKRIGFIILAILIIAIFISSSLRNQIVSDVVGGEPGENDFIVDSKGNTYFFWLKETVKKVDDKIYFTKIDPNGILLISKKQVVGAQGIKEIVASFEKSNTEVSSPIILSWKDNSESLDYDNENTATHYDKTYALKLEENGKIIEKKFFLEDSIYGKEIRKRDEAIRDRNNNYFDAYSSIAIDNSKDYSDYSIISINQEEELPKKYKFSIDGEENKYLFSNNCRNLTLENASNLNSKFYLCLMKFSSSGNLIYSKEILKMPPHKECGAYKTCDPVLFSPIMKIDKYNNIHVSTYSNNGFNDFVINYLTINPEGEVLKKLKLN